MNSLVLDNYKLLDCLQKHQIITPYLDSLEDYQLNTDDLWMPKGIRSKSLLPHKAYQLLISSKDKRLHLVAGYLLLSLDRIGMSDYQAYRLLTSDGYSVSSTSKPNPFRFSSTPHFYTLKKILRPSKKYIGLAHRARILEKRKINN